MPCYDARNNEPQTVYKTGISPDDMKQVKQELEFAGAIVCALINELSRRDILESVIGEASRHGLIDIMGWWSNHKNEDRTRLANDIHKRYSKDELKVLKDLLNQA